MAELPSSIDIRVLGLPEIEQMIQAAEAMHSALKNFPCTCVFQYPYAPRGEQKTLCARCRSMKQWEFARDAGRLTPVQAKEPS